MLLLPLAGFVQHTCQSSLFCRQILRGLHTIWQLHIW